MADCDAVVQETEALARATAASERFHLHPGRRPGTRVPRRLWGLPRLLWLRRAERRLDLHHVLNPDPFPYPLLAGLRRPIIYTAVGGIGGAPRPLVATLGRRVAALVVPDETDRERLASWGLPNAHAILPGIDLDRLAVAPPPARPPFTLLMGSAPWTREQFRSKGVEALLAAAAQRIDLRLVFLWRGVLAEEMRHRVARADLDDRVEVLDRRVDVPRLLSRVHAAVLLAARPFLVKSYPHSLLEALAAGRPVLASPTLALAGRVGPTGAGVVVPEVGAPAVLAALDQLERGYPERCQAARELAADFALPRFVDAYRRLYEEVAPPRSAAP